ncbi:MAG: ABC transporter permease [Parvibaculaceae bacterium]
MNNEKFLPAGARHFGSFNWLGMWTLYVKEVRRFIKVITQTVLAPVVTTLLFLAIFSLALGRQRPDINGVPFTEFLAPGLIMMTMLQNAFANTSSSIMISKVQGNIVDVLMPPLSAGELNVGFAMAGVTRGALVGFVTALGMLPFVSFSITHLWAVVFFGAGASLMLSLLGILGGIWSEKFDHLQAVTNFIITPLAFLSGTFYSVTQLPGFAYTFTQYNPFFYLIDGFRYAFTGISDGSITTGIWVTIGCNAVLWVVTDQVLRRGYRLKA